MVEHDPRAIANEFLKLNYRTMSQMKLQKLVYLAHGWNLVINDHPLVSGQIEAWDGGPVMRTIYNHIRDFGYNAGRMLEVTKNRPFTAELTNGEKKIIEHVWRRYGNYSSLELSKMTHMPGTPWSNAYFGSGRNSAISRSDIAKHFRELAIAGRKQSA